MTGMHTVCLRIRVGLTCLSQTEQSAVAAEGSPWFVVSDQGTRLVLKRRIPRRLGLLATQLPLYSNNTYTSCMQQVSHMHRHDSAANANNSKQSKMPLLLSNRVATCMVFGDAYYYVHM